uniref:Uncharacterized protein n=1 Tax=Panagrolaimus sp. PS1159 TaxID=55785 RepID=A0AC35GTT1_9BILA
MAFGGHMLRFGVLGIVVERLFATIYWRTYQIRPTFQTFIAISLTAASISVTFIITLLTHLFRVDMNLRNIAIFITHTGSLCVALFLIYKNQKLHIHSRFRPLLLQRYQLAQNLKNLRILKPYIIIMATLGPITPLIYQILYLIGDSTIDVSIPVLYTLYDLSLIMCEIIFLYSIFKTQYQVKATSTVSTAYIKQEPQKHVQTALGTYIPTLQTADDYFVELRNTWM